MAYRFKLDEPIRDGARRMLAEQLELAARRLGDADAATGVHEMRKCLKRGRALLRLVRPALDKADFMREDRRLRDFARRLSGARDSHVLIDTIAAVAQSPQGRRLSPRQAAILEALRTEAQQVVHQLGNSAGRHDELAQELERAARRMRKLELRKGGLASLARGLEDSYRAGRKALARACRQDRDADWHEARKEVQRHWRQLVLLARAWPEAMEARVALAKELSQLMGDDHDLAVLKTRLLGRRRKADASGVRALVDLCEERQRRLRRLARPRLQRLFAERPRAFARRITVYWRSARRLRREMREEPIVVNSAPRNTKA